MVAPGADDDVFLQFVEQVENLPNPRHLFSKELARENTASKKILAPTRDEQKLNQDDLYRPGNSVVKRKRIQSFPSRFCNECPGRKILLKLGETPSVYSRERPHSRRGYRSFEEFVKTKIITS